MTTMIGTSTDSETLGRFLYDFRRALLRHRKSRMAFLYAIRFPDADQGDFSGESEPDKLDFQNWLDSAPPAEISGNSLYRQLQAVQANFIRMADAAVATSRNGMLSPERYAEMLRLMLRLDILADRLASGITTAMTDLDALTGLLNRAAMERDLAQVQGAAKSGGQTFTIAMVDADHFKQVNDTHGHAFGDIVLQTLAERFVESLRPRDQVYRYGGEEFLLLFPDTDLVRAWPVLERLRQRANAEPIGDGKVGITITVSVGATIVVVGEENMKTAIERADAALYQAKQAGRNRVKCEPPITTTPTKGVNAMNDNPNTHQDTAPEQTATPEVARYDRFVELSRELFDKGQEKGREAWEKAMELARQQLAAAGEFSADQGEAFKHYLRRDLDQTKVDMQQLGVEAQDRLNPARVGAGALSSLAKLLHAAGGAMLSWSEQAESALEFKTGEITSAGTLTCLACGQKVHLKATGVVPPCPSCHATRYRKGY